MRGLAHPIVQHRREEGLKGGRREGVSQPAGLPANQKDRQSSSPISSKARSKPSSAHSLPLVPDRQQLLLSEHHSAMQSLLTCTSGRYTCLCPHEWWFCPSQAQDKMRLDGTLGQRRKLLSFALSLFYYYIYLYAALSLAPSQVGHDPHIEDPIF